MRGAKELPGARIEREGLRRARVGVEDPQATHAVTRVDVALPRAGREHLARPVRDDAMVGGHLEGGIVSRRRPAMAGTSTSVTVKWISGSSRIHQPPGPVRPRWNAIRISAPSTLAAWPCGLAGRGWGCSARRSARPPRPRARPERPDGSPGGSAASDGSPRCSSPSRRGMWPSGRDVARPPLVATQGRPRRVPPPRGMRSVRGGGPRPSRGGGRPGAPPAPGQEGPPRFAPGAAPPGARRWPDAGASFRRRGPRRSGPERRPRRRARRVPRPRGRTPARSPPACGAGGRPARPCRRRGPRAAPRR